MPARAFRVATAPARRIAVESAVKTTALLLAAVTVLVCGCSAPYYQAMEKLGIAKREILVDRVQATRTAQENAKEQFATALERFQEVTRADGGDLQRKYDLLSREFSRSETRAKEVRDRIAAVEDVADALFDEWKSELRQYTDPTLRREAEREFDRTQARYKDLIRVMKRAANRMDPVLDRFRDQVLFVKHNLNAQMLASLGNTQRELETDISQLISEMEAAIRDAEAFINTLRQNSPAN